MLLFPILIKNAGRDQDLEPKSPSEIHGNHSYTKSNELTTKSTYKTLTKARLIRPNEVHIRTDKFLIKMGGKGA